MHKTQLSPAIAGKFKLVGLYPGVHIMPDRFGSIKVDFSTITLEEAEKLMLLPNFNYLERIVTKTPPKVEKKEAE